MEVEEKKKPSLKQKLVVCFVVIIVNLSYGCFLNMHGFRGDYYCSEKVELYKKIETAIETVIENDPQYVDLINKIMTTPTSELDDSDKKAYPEIIYLTTYPIKYPNGYIFFLKRPYEFIRTSPEKLTDNLKYNFYRYKRKGILEYILPPEGVEVYIYTYHRKSDNFKIEIQFDKDELLEKIKMESVYDSW